MPERRLLVAWSGVLGAVVIASLVPGGEDEKGAGISLVSVAHVPAYAALTATTAGLLASAGTPRRRAAVSAALASIAVGALLEAVQPLVGRDGNFTDLALDGIGAGAMAYGWGYGWRPRRRETSI